MNPLLELETRLQQSLGHTVIGMQDLIRALLIATISRGHVLVQGAPGLGKTLLGKTLAVVLFRQREPATGCLDWRWISANTYPRSDCALVRFATIFGQLEFRA